MDTCPTVHVVSADSPDGFIVINESDFDAGVHQLFGDEEKPKRTRKPKEVSEE
jgi:hypothetical protein